MPIVWSFPDGHIELTTIAEHALERAIRPQETRSEAVLRVAQELQNKAPYLKLGVPSLIRTADVPTSREHREKWVLKDGKIEVTHG
jgi:hypothetical protein